MNYKFSQIHESSPSFCTDQPIQFNSGLSQSCRLTLDEPFIWQQSGQSLRISRDNNSQQSLDSFNQNNRPLTLNRSISSSIPSLQRHRKNKQCPNFSQQISSDSLSSLNFFKQINPSQQFQTNSAFLPDTKTLTQHIDFLQKQLFFRNKQYLKIRTFCESVLHTIKTVVSKQVGKELQKYFQNNFLLAKLQDSFKDLQNNFQAFSQYSEISKQFIDKLQSESLSYSIDLNSQRVSKNLQQIFTLGSSRFLIHQTQPKIQKQYQMNDKSTQKKARNSKNRPKEKQNILFQDFQAGRKNVQSKKTKQISNYNNVGIKNESMKFLINQCISTGNSQGISNLNNNVSQARHLSKGKVASQILCQICNSTFLPYEFFKHLQRCNPSNLDLQSTQKLTLNYTMMMQKLFDMRQEIESQIQLLSGSKQKSKEKLERQALKQKLLKDLQKVTKIIQQKQKQMEIYLSKSLGSDRLKDSLRLCIKTNKNR